MHYNHLCMEYTPSNIVAEWISQLWSILGMSFKSDGLCFCPSTQVGAASTNQSVADVLKEMQGSDDDDSEGDGEDSWGHGDDSWPADVASNMLGAQLIPTPNR